VRAMGRQVRLFPMKLPQLSLRELFLLVALVAMGCGWWAHVQKAYRDGFREGAILERFRQEEHEPR
jgi:hypothetical protein